ncbi:hypothetical protein B296_00005675 [Ensete ventricosum]|uniref:Uncharacterized protein n=1 Tax=Ensete ventricosum TaxID=4639 RepID=A0A426ZA41_ENSVE|nr:hypothetical protein B296_00005675 [Ensete ventricosum]
MIKLKHQARLGRCSGSSTGVRYDFTKGIRKIARNTPRDYRGKTVRLAAGNAGGCRIARVRLLIKLGGHVTRVWSSSKEDWLWTPVDLGVEDSRSGRRLAKAEPL